MGTDPTETNPTPPPERRRRLIEDAVREARAAKENAPPVPDRIAGYSIEGLLGRGGMGVVYRARQDAPRREVAVKVLASQLLSRDAVRRFRYEADVLGRLEHPGIARIFEAGIATSEHGQQPFIAMELVEGERSVTRYARDVELGTRSILELMTEICDAVEHAHQKGIIHRDLKPGNILIDRSGQPKIVDFGVARAIESEEGALTFVTSSLRPIGTLPYMSPEQVSGRAEDVDTRSDVYSLGVVLFRLLTGRMPYTVRGASYLDAARTICADAPLRPSALEPSLAGDLETVVLKALEKDPARRYQSASAFRDDLRRCLEHKAVQARPPSVVYVARKFVRRNRLLVALGGGVLLAIVLGVSGTFWQAHRARRQVEVTFQTLLMFTDAMGDSNSGWLSHAENRVLLDDLASSSARVFRGDPEFEARLRDLFCVMYGKLDEHDHAEEQARRLLSLTRQTNGDGDASTLRAVDVLCDTLRAQDKLEEALRAARDGLRVVPDAEALTEARDPEDPYLALRLLRLRYKVAVCLHDLGDLGPAEREYRVVLGAQLRIIGGTLGWNELDHENIAETRWGLARLLMDRGAADGGEEAVVLLRGVVDHFRRHRSIRHENIRAHLTLAEALTATGRHDQASRELEEAKRLCAMTTPVTDRIVAHMRLVEAALLSIDSPGVAEGLLLEAIELASSDSVPAWRVASYRVHYAGFVSGQGRAQEANEQYAIALEAYSERFGASDYRANRAARGITP